MTRIAIVLVAAVLAACLPMPQSQPSQPQPAAPQLPPQQADQPQGAAAASDPITFAPPVDTSAFTGTFTARRATLELVVGDDGQVAGSIRGKGVAGTIEGVVDGDTLTGELTIGDGITVPVIATATEAGVILVVDGKRSLALARKVHNYGKGHGRIPPAPPP